MDCTQRKKIEVSILALMATGGLCVEVCTLTRLGGLTDWTRKSSSKLPGRIVKPAEACSDQKGCWSMMTP